MNLFLDALVDTAKLLPLLAAAYFLVSFFEYRYSSSMGLILSRFRRYGPVLGAFFGCIPQCGFSVIASALYVKRAISVGTLLSVFLSTSDEAIPILLSIPNKAHLVGDLIIIKVIVAILAGLAVDFLIKRSALAPVSADNVVLGHSGCCSHDVDERRFKIKSLLIHPLQHTLKIFFFLLILSTILNFAVTYIGAEKISGLLLSGSLLQPVITALIGLIPNCFSSVLLAGLFVKGEISFGSLVSGLCAGAGLGMLVLIKENKNLKDTLRIIGLLVGISVLAGVVIQIASKV